MIYSNVEICKQLPDISTYFFGGVALLFEPIGEDDVPDVITKFGVGGA
ncbi:MAG: hypothetical protein IPN58_01095 [Anaerolineales bacterium]|nr:hypothetical protein [Anaerolineales bacterium]